MTHTTNYNFNLPAGTDPAAAGPLNQNFTMIDTYLKSNLNQMAEDYDSSETYNTDDIVAHDNALYKCNDDNVTGTWDSTKWDATTLGEEVGQGGGSSVVVNPSGTQDEVLDGIEVDGTNYGLDVLGEINNVAAASFSDGADLPISKCIVNVEAVQDLHGYDNPWVGGAGKNKLPMTVDGIKAFNISGTWSGNAYTINGVTFTILTDNGGNVTGINANGTASVETLFIVGMIEEKPSVDAYLNGCPNGGSVTTYRLTANRAGSDTGNGFVIYPSSDWNKYVSIYIFNSFTVNNLIFKPMVRISGDPTFEPYSNICPIEGWDSGEISVVGKNWLPPTTSGTQGITRNVDFNTTVYGGSANLLTGDGNDEYFIYEVTSVNRSNSRQFYKSTSTVKEETDYAVMADKIKPATSSSDRGVFVNSSGAIRFNTEEEYATAEEMMEAYGGSIKVWCKRKTSEAFTYTPIPTTNTLVGVNNIYADCGDINTLGYFKDGKLTRSVKAIVEAMTGNANAILADAIGEE